MDKNICKIEYKSGAVENLEMRNYVIHVLEGTPPVFDLRRRKYYNYSKE